MRTRYLAASAVTAVTALLLSISIASAQTIRVEGENYLPPPASGPNEAQVVNIGDGDGGRDVSFFISWDYLEWGMTVPDEQDVRRILRVAGGNH